MVKYISENLNENFELNPLSRIKKDYKTLIIAENENNFFIDINDLQKCADLNNESITEAVAKVIKVNEDSNMNIDNLTVVVNENANIDSVEELSENGVLLEADFSLLPKFKKDPEIKACVNELKNAEKILKLEKIKSKTSSYKVLRTILRVFSIITNIDSAFGLVGCLTIIGIIPYAFGRAIDFLIDFGYEASAQSEGKAIIRAIDKELEKKSLDPKLKSKLIDIRKSMQDKLNHIDN